MMLPSNTSVGL
uniref:Uncharacterized protein n=1 Tax=Arundo donax TaxID=35708 RepID=A0A0A8ZQX3_ARUDO